MKMAKINRIVTIEAKLVFPESIAGAKKEDIEKTYVNELIKNFGAPEMVFDAWNAYSVAFHALGEHPSPLATADEDRAILTWQDAEQLAAGVAFGHIVQNCLFELIFNETNESAE